jgi:drug/metabolite transporter (DMT)-like permease
MKTALVLCLVAALGYGVGAVLQALGARHAAVGGTIGLKAMIKQPMFLFGLLADFGSWVISRFALHTLPLFAVQTILAGSLAVTVVLAGIVLGAELRKPDRWAIVATVAGLVIVGVSAGSDEARDVTHLLKLCILAGIPAIVAAAFFAIKANKAVILAVLAGVAFTSSALAARTIKIKGESIAGIFTEPMLWAMLIYAVIALGIHAGALMRGEVGPVTAAMWATEVLVAVVIGAVALEDHMRPGWTVPAAFGIALTLAATVVLARSPAQDLEHRALPMVLTVDPAELDESDESEHRHS